MLIERMKISQVSYHWRYVLYRLKHPGTSEEKGGDRTAPHRTASHRIARAPNRVNRVTLALAGWLSLFFSRTRALFARFLLNAVIADSRSTYHLARALYSASRFKRPANNRRERQGYYFPSAPRMESRGESGATERKYMGQFCNGCGDARRITHPRTITAHRISEIAPFSTISRILAACRIVFRRERSGEQRRATRIGSTHGMSSMQLIYARDSLSLVKTPLAMTDTVDWVSVQSASELLILIIVCYTYNLTYLSDNK